jgi:hypothetical protein
MALAKLLVAAAEGKVDLGQFLEEFIAMAKATA